MVLTFAALTLAGTAFVFCGTLLLGRPGVARSHA
jgi:hypothetical protein